MKSITYTTTGPSDVLRLTDRPLRDPGPGEVRVRVHISGVNPTDWKSRQGSRAGDPVPLGEQVPNQDGAGVVDAVGAGVDGARIGERVWIWEAAHQRVDGTAQEFTVVPADQAVPLPAAASFEVGAGVGIPALTAHRALTVGEDGPRRLAPGALAGRTVLVSGGAGAVGHAAIELARWAGADQVISTISSDEKARLATAAGAHHTVNYRTDDAAAAIRRLAPDGVDIVVEVAPGPNADLDAAVIAPNGTVAFYANNGGDSVTLPIRPLMVHNARWQAILVYTIARDVKLHAVADVSAALAAGALRVGDDAGLPLHRFPLDRTAEAHDAVENGAVGKVLIDIG